MNCKKAARRLGTLAGIPVLLIPSAQSSGFHVGEESHATSGGICFPQSVPAGGGGSPRHWWLVGGEQMGSGECAGVGVKMEVPHTGVLASHFQALLGLRAV